MSNVAIQTFTGGGLVPVMDAAEARCQSVSLPAGVTLAAGTVLGQVTATSAQNDVQTITITGTPTGGGLYLSFLGQLTAQIAYNAAAAAVQSALEALSTIGTGNVACSGGPFPGSAVVVTFQGKCANLDQPVLTSINSLTGGSSPAIGIVHTTTGNPGFAYYKAYDDAKSDGTQIAKALLQYAVTVDAYGCITYAAGEWLEASRSTPAYFAGTFKTADLTGLDAAGVADLGRLINGSTSALSAASTILRIG